MDGRLCLDEATEIVRIMLRLRACLVGRRTAHYLTTTVPR